jgi:uncharacterized phage protein (TIGR01671 family)
MRTIKFRFWSKVLNRFVVPDDSIFKGALSDPNMEVMQYTGLKDKNGTKIYEGDIVKVTERENPMSWIAQVKNIGWSGYRLVSVEQSNWFTNETYKEQLEVIGNIYENPELLTTISN